MPQSRLWPAIDVRLSAAAAVDAEALQGVVLAALDDSAVTALQELPGGWRIFFATSLKRDDALGIVAEAWPGELDASPVDVPDDDWARRSQKDLGPVLVGGIAILPEAGTEKGSPAPIEVVIRPSMGFGTGHHASTRLCLALMQQIDLPGRRVLDVGTGSGLLAIVAARLGAGFVLAVDDDPDALESARENLALNAVTAVELRCADFRTLPDAGFDLVLANLTGALLVAGAATLTRAVAPGGSLVISGLMLDEEADVRAAITASTTLVSRLEEDEWLALRFVRSARPQ